jgi:hypothetical protein
MKPLDIIKEVDIEYRLAYLRYQLNMTLQAPLNHIPTTEQSPNKNTRSLRFILEREMLSKMTMLVAQRQSIISTIVL